MEIKELLRKMIVDLQKQVAEKVAEKGLFDVVYERYENPDPSRNLTHIILKVSSATSSPDEEGRYLELAAMNYPNPYGSETVVGFGSKAQILKKLSEEGLEDMLLEKLRRLEHNIEDIEWRDED